jgi:predicted dehydrogenase
MPVGRTPRTAGLNRTRHRNQDHGMATSLPVRWGILGCGNIARQFAEGLRFAPGATLAAVGSRDGAKAEAFREKHGATRAHASYEALAADPDVDAVYIATPHVFHCANTLACLAGGKAVLCEKPFAVNAAEARQMVAAARARGLFLMEAMWSRFFPAAGRLREIVALGSIGEPRMVQADFGFRAGWNPEGRLLNPALGGGALLDVGIYTVAFASMVLGRPVEATGFAHRGETGVDEQSAMILRHKGGALSVLSTAVRTSTPHEAQVWGTEGRIRVVAPFWKPSTLLITHSPWFGAAAPKPSMASICSTIASARRYRSGWPCGSSARCATLAPT